MSTDKAITVEILSRVVCALVSTAEHCTEPELRSSMQDCADRLIGDICALTDNEAAAG